MNLIEVQSKKENGYLKFFEWLRNNLKQTALNLMLC